MRRRYGAPARARRIGSSAPRARSDAAPASRLRGTPGGSAPRRRPCRRPRRGARVATARIAYPLASAARMSRGARPVAARELRGARAASTPLGEVRSNAARARPPPRRAPRTAPAPTPPSAPSPSPLVRRGRTGTQAKTMRFAQCLDGDVPVLVPWYHAQSISRRGLLRSIELIYSAARPPRASRQIFHGRRARLVFDALRPLHSERARSGIARVAAPAGSVTRAPRPPSSYSRMPSLRCRRGNRAKSLARNVPVGAPAAADGAAPAPHLAAAASLHVLRGG